MEVHHCSFLILASNYVVKLHNQPAGLTPIPQRKPQNFVGTPHSTGN